MKYVPYSTPSPGPARADIRGADISRFYEITVSNYGRVAFIAPHLDTGLLFVCVIEREVGGCRGYLATRLQ